MFQFRIFDELTAAAEGPSVGSGGGSGLVVSMAVFQLFNAWTRLIARLDSEIQRLSRQDLSDAVGL